VSLRRSSVRGKRKNAAVSTILKIGEVYWPKTCSCVYAPDGSTEHYLVT
jgi:hypothetical protein